MIKIALAVVISLLLVWLGCEVYKRWRKFEARDELEQASHDAEATRLRREAERKRMEARNG